MSTAMNNCCLLLIDSRVPDIETIIGSLNNDTVCAVFNYYHDTPETILSKIRFLNRRNCVIRENFFYEEPPIPVITDPSNCLACDASGNPKQYIAASDIAMQAMEYALASGNYVASDTTIHQPVPTLWPISPDHSSGPVPVFFQRMGQLPVLVTELDEIYKTFITIPYESSPDSTVVADTVFSTVGIIQHSYGAETYMFLKSFGSAALLTDVAIEDPALQTWQPFISTLTGMITRHKINTLDLMACALYADPNWKYVIDELQTRMAVNIRASTDNTGSSAMGGNWILETDSANLKDVYFTDAIHGWNHLLATITDTRFYTMQFNNSMYLTYPGSSTAVNVGTGDFTFETWYYETSKQTHCTIFDKGAYNYTWQIRNLNDGLSFRGSSNWLYATTAVVPVAQWSHLAITRSGATFKFYINGTLMQTMTNSSTLNNNGSNFSIGLQAPDNCLCNKLKTGCRLYDVRMWNVCRTDTQIQQNRNRIVPATTTGLVANYGLTFPTSTAATAATTISDRTSNAINMNFVSYTNTWSNDIPVPNIGFYIENNYLQDVITEPSNLVAQYRFDSNALDSSPNNNTLTNVSSVTFNTSEYKHGTAAASFNGSNYFQIANDGRFSPDNFTIAFWVNPIATSGTHQAIASCRNTTGTIIGWMIYIAPDNNLEFITGASSSYSGGSVYSNFGALFQNKWVHVAITVNKTSGSCILYVNGSSYLSTTRTYVNNTGTNMRIGAGVNESSADFMVRNGTLIDDFRFYNQVLTSSEVTAISRVATKFAVNYGDLTSTDFSGVNFTGVNFRSTTLTGSNFTNCNFTNATLVNVTVDSSTNFTGATFTGITSSGITGSPILSAEYVMSSGAIVSALPLPTIGALTAIPTKTYGTDVSFNITAPTTNSSGAFTYTSSNEGVATLNNPNPNALQFDGVNDTVAVSSYPALNSTNTLTIEGWFYTSGYSKIFLLINSNLSFEINAQGNISLYTTTASGGSYSIISDSAITLNAWVYIAVVKNDNGYNKLYVNNTLVKTVVDTTSGVFIASTGFSLGANAQANLYYSIRMSEFRMWTVARTAQQIADNYNIQIPANSSGLVIYYKFNQGTPNGTNTGLTTLTDSTSNNYHGTLTGFALTGTTSNWVLGPTNPNALTFDGVNDKVALSSYPTFNSTNTLTIEGWIYTTGYSKMIVMINSNLSFEIDAQGKIMLYVVTVGSGGTAIISDSAIPLNVWVYIAAVRNDNGYNKIYVNNTIVKNAVDTTSGLLVAATGFSLGADAQANTNYSSIRMSEFRIWSVARTAQQLADNYNIQIPANSSGLVIYYKFNQGTPNGTNTGLTTLTDSTSNNYHGTLTGFALTGTTSNWVSGPTRTSPIVCTIVGAGTSTITATQAADATYLSGSVSTVLTVSGIQPTFGTFTLGPKAGAYVLADVSFSLTAPTSNSSGAFSYASDNSGVATIVNVAQSGTTLYSITSPAPRTLSLTNFPILGAMPTWEMNIRFTVTGGANSWRALIGDMYNTVNTGRGWGVWVSSSNGLHFSWNNFTWDATPIAVVLNTEYVLKINRTPTSLTFLLTTVSTGATQTATNTAMSNTATYVMSVNGPVTIGGWISSTNEQFPGTFAYVTVINPNYATSACTSTNLLARYDASVASAYTLSGSNVTQWNDLTGNGYHLIPNGTGPTTTTINSVTAFNFNSGLGLYRTLVPLSTAITVFMVAKYSTAIATWGSFMHHGHRDTDWSLERNNGSGASGLTVQFQIENDNTYCQIAAANNTNYIWVGRITGNTRQFWMYSDTLVPVYVTSSTPAVTISGGNKSIYVGKSDAIANEGCNSSIGEILYYNASLSDADVNTNVNYLQNKWLYTKYVPYTVATTRVSLISNGLANITAIQDACGNYMSKSVSSALTVGTMPTFGTFTLGPKSGVYNLSDVSFSLTAPTSDSSGGFLYASDNSAVAVIAEPFTIIRNQTFGVVGTTNWVVPAGVTSVSALIIAGGGGGGRDMGGGGGAGGVIINTNIAVTPGASMNIVVGSGGNPPANSGLVASNGGNSSFAGLIAIGGGGGGSLTNTAGADGGSAGGRGGTQLNQPGRATTTPLQGNNGGGTSASFIGAGGGGGAGQVGGVSLGSNLGGKGGDGISSDISGSIVYYAGGGGGGGHGGVGGSGGIGGGGKGADNGGQSASSGTDGLGGGGGGGGGTVTSGPGARGGSGIVIISYVSMETRFGTAISSSSSSTKYVSLISDGTANITATQDACGNYRTKSVSSLLTVDSLPIPTFGTFTVESSKTYGDASFNITLRPTSNSSGAITYTSSNTGVATIDASGDWITILSAGDVSFNAAQAAVAGQFKSAIKTSNTLTVYLATSTLSASTFSVPATKIYGDASFNIITRPTSNSAGAITYASNNTGVATIDASGNWITLVSAGDVSFNATQAATSQYASATKTSTVLIVSIGTPTLSASTFAVANTKIYGEAAFGISTRPTSNSTGAITYTSSNPGVATIDVSGNTITLISAGDVSFNATQAAVTGKFTSATKTSNTLTVALATPTLSATTFSVTASKIYGDASFNVTTFPTSNSAGAITYSSSNPSVATIEASAAPAPKVIIYFGNNYTGSSLELDAGNYADNWLAPRGFNDNIGSIIIPQGFSVTVWSNNFGGTSTTYTSNISVTTVASISSLQISGSSSPICRINILSAGTATFTATQAATAQYAGATKTSNTLTVDLATPTLSASTFSVPTTKTYSDASFNVTTLPTSNSTGEITYSSGNPSVATIDASGNWITIVGTGDVSFNATQAAVAGRFTSATKTSNTLTIYTATPSLVNAVFTVAGEKTYGDASFNISLRPTSNSTGAITYSSSNTGVATIDASGNWITIVSAGDVSFNAAQAAVTGQFISATKTSNTLTISPQMPVLSDTFSVATTKRYGDPTFGIITETTSNVSNGAITYSSVTLDTSNNALSFDGTNDYVTTSVNITSLAKANFTIEAWVKTSGTRMGLVTCSDGDNTWESSEKAFYIDVSGNPAFVGFGNGYIKSNLAVNDGEWHHIAVAWAYSGSGNTGTGTIYVDGVDRTNTGTTDYSAVNANYGSFQFGLPNYASEEAINYFNGSMCELRIWNVARTRLQIVDTMTSRNISASSTGLVAYYPMNVGTANGSNVSLTTLYDSTSNARNGTLTNFALSGTTSNYVSGPAKTGIVSIDTSGSVITIYGVGNAAFVATQAAVSGQYTSATRRSNTITVSRGTAPALTGISATLTGKTVGDAAFTVTAVSSASAGAITYTSSNTGAATVVSSTGVITPVGSGITSIVASQAASTIYDAPSSDLSGSLSVTGVPVLTGMAATLAKNVTDASFVLQATSASSGVITYSTSNSLYATVITDTANNTGVVTLKGAGTVTITASQAAAALYTAATATCVITVSSAGAVLAGQTISSGTSFSGVDLSGASFAGSTLSGVSFSGAKLTGVNFSGAVITGTNFTNANISGATNLPTFSTAQKLQLLLNVNNSGVGAAQISTVITGATLSAALASPITGTAGEDIAAATFVVRAPTSVDASDNKVISIGTTDVSNNTSIYIPLNANETVKINGAKYTYTGSAIVDASGVVKNYILISGVPFKVYSGSIIAVNVYEALALFKIGGIDIITVCNDLLVAR